MVVAHWPANLWRVDDHQSASSRTRHDAADVEFPLEPFLRGIRQELPASRRQLPEGLRLDDAVLGSVRCLWRSSTHLCGRQHFPGDLA